MGVFDLATGALLGSMSLSRAADNSAEIGYWTAADARGRGVATRAGRALARWAFDGFDLRRITWRAHVGNHASKLVARRIGVTVDGIERAALPAPGGGFVDDWVGSILPGEVLTATPAVLAAGSAAALQAATFSATPPRLTLPPGGPAGSLRLPSVRDAASQIIAFQDPESVRWTGVPLEYGEAEAMAGYTAAVREWTLGDAALFTVADENDDYVGTTNLGLYLTRQLPDTAEVGYTISPSARGNGYATAALATISEWGFTALGLRRIVWRAQVGNDASRRVAEKAGFAYEGIQRGAWRQRGEFRDVWAAARTATDPR